MGSRIKYFETKSKNNVINDSRGRNGRKVNFFFTVKKVVICLRIPTVCWMDGKTFLCQRKYTAESLVPKPSAVDGRDALWKVEGRSYDIVQISLEMFQSGGRIMLSAIHIIKYNHNMEQLSQTNKKGSIIMPIKQVDRNR